MTAKVWAAIDAGTYRVVWTDGRAWLLTATPRDRRPWLLVAEDGGEQQEIGAREVDTAQGVAEFWLSLSSDGVYPRARI